MHVSTSIQIRSGTFPSLSIAPWRPTRAHPVTCCANTATLPRNPVIRSSKSHLQLARTSGAAMAAGNLFALLRGLGDRHFPARDSAHARAAWESADFLHTHEQRENIEVIVQPWSVWRTCASARSSPSSSPFNCTKRRSPAFPSIALPRRRCSRRSFFPNNAIHDGGVIIKGDRIAYAACIFPLTRRQDLNKSSAPGIARPSAQRRNRCSGGRGLRRDGHDFLRVSRANWCAGCQREELRAFLSSMLLQPADRAIGSTDCATLLPNFQARPGRGEIPLQEHGLP